MINKIYDVALVKCEDYSEKNVKNAFDELLPMVGRTRLGNKRNENCY